MANADIHSLVLKKAAREAAEKFFWLPGKAAEPIQGVQWAEANYYGFTAVSALQALRAIHLSDPLTNTILPVAWNYMDGVCALGIGVNQLMDEDDYHQTQLKIKGLLNIFSGIQLFVLSYNPALTAALGATGAPAALAGASFALAMLVDVVTALIDFGNAAKEKNVRGWWDERMQEHAFLEARIQEITAENVTLEAAAAQGDGFFATAAARYFARNNDKLLELQRSRDELRIKMGHRYHHNGGEAFFRVAPPGWLPPAGEDDKSEDGRIQAEIDSKYNKALNTLTIKTASLAGMSLLAVGGFFLVSSCPPAVVITGLALTAFVAALYLYQHANATVKAANDALSPDEEPVAGAANPGV